ncbi:poly(A) polymerase gamma-like [Contarinia nasturtii]|uniref:poly(A) polymerase gamma-like n=1 Tax=Contarinia nasturtii TaxID=265458 RepID=UPI0012D40CE0|nr:poly(A) polymerase gamma-like [Contarinia nasturtii]
MNSTFNVSSSTKKVIQMELERGHGITEEVMMKKATWDKLFEELNFFRKYRHFLVVLVGSQTAEDHLAWRGFIESKVRDLVGYLDEHLKLKLAHENPKCFDRQETQNTITDADHHLIIAPYCSMWFIGMMFTEKENLNVDLQEIKYKQGVIINLLKCKTD